MSTTQPLSRFETSITFTVDAERSYTVKSPGIKTGAYLVESAALIDASQAAIEAGEEVPAEVRGALEALGREGAPGGPRPEDQYRAILGDVYDQMIEDDVPYEALRLMVASILVWVQQGRDEAIEFWDCGGNPTNRKARRSKKSTSRRTSTARTRRT